jgi:hypothetical protein
MAVEIIRPASRADWLAARKQDVTASVAGCLIDSHLPVGERHPYMTPYELWAEKAGKLPTEDDDNPVFRRGRLFEAVAIEMLREDRPDWTVTYSRDNAYFRDPDRRLGATPDAFAERPENFGTGVVQVKTVFEDAFKKSWLYPDGTIRLPLWIAVQATIEAQMTGAEWACCALFVYGRGIELHVVDVPIMPRLKDRLREAVREFWQVFDSGETPPIDWKRDGAVVLEVFKQSLPDRRDMSGDAGFDDLVARYVAARDQAGAAQADADLLRPQIVFALGNSELAISSNFEISARASYRPPSVIKGGWARPLRIKQRIISHGDF